jgi:hypothetical protein
MRTGCLLAIALLFADLFGANAEEAQEPPVKICMCGFTVEGLGPEIISAAITAIVEELKAMDVEVSPSPVPEPVLAEECFEDPACLRESGENLGIDGILDVSILRSGPMVRISFRLFASTTGAKLIETATVAPFQDFPGTAPIARNLEPVLKTIRDVKPAEAVAPAEESRPVEEAAPPPPPPQPPEPAPVEEVAKVAPAPEMAPPPESLPEVKAPAPARPDPTRTWGWAMVGVGAAVLAGAGVTGILTIQLDDDLSAKCDAAHKCAPDLQGDVDRLDTLALTTDVLLGVGAAAVITGTLLLTVFSGDAHAGDLKVQPSLGPGTVGASISGRF